MRFFSQLNSGTAGRSRAGLALAVCALLQDAACGGNTPIQPPPPPPALALSCPAPLDSEATRPDGAAVDFDIPQPMGGSPPYIVQCAPPSGSIFAPGDTTVECTASDAGMAPASCSFVVTVRISEKLTKSKFMAFGDSITAGEISPAPFFTFRDPLEAYPYKLEQMLRARYPAQDILVINRGFGGEDTSGGVRRLPGVLDSDQPEVLLLLEGVNGISRVTPSTVATNLRTMVSLARQRNVDVIIATLMPVARPYTNSRPGANARIRDVNERIIEIAAEFGLGEPVDLYNLFLADMSLIGMDGLHPTAHGYTRMAEAFAAAIEQRYSERTQSVQQP